MMPWVFAGGVVVGALLTAWSVWTNPAGAMAGPDPLPPGTPRITTGPYRFLSHPMYVGQWILVVGCAGLAAGPWNAVAFGVVLDLLFRDWILREQKGS